MAANGSNYLPHRCCARCSSAALRNADHLPLGAEKEEESTLVFFRVQIRCSPTHFHFELFLMPGYSWPPAQPRIPNLLFKVRPPEDTVMMMRRCLSVTSWSIKYGTESRLNSVN